MEIQRGEGSLDMDRHDTPTERKRDKKVAAGPETTLDSHYSYARGCVTLSPLHFSPPSLSTTTMEFGVCNYARRSRGEENGKLDVTA